MLWAAAVCCAFSRHASPRTLIDSCASLKAMVQVFAAHWCVFVSFRHACIYDSGVDVSTRRQCYMLHTGTAIRCIVRILSIFCCPEVFSCSTPNMIIFYCSRCNPVRIFAKHTDLNVATCLEECSCPQESVSESIEQLQHSS